MNQLEIQFTSKPVDKIVSNLIVATIFSDVRPFHGTAALLDWRLNGRLSKIIMKHKFKGNFRESLLLPSEGRIKSKEILLVGLGAYDSFNESYVAAYVQYLLKTMANMKMQDFLVSFTDFIADRFEWRNSVRLLVSRLRDYPVIEKVRLCESEDCIKEAKRRQMDFGLNVDVSFDTLAA
ncbi:MAG: hypothetical protein ACD_73C00279G0009 [uncultured bacterium]|nr:MAG: hypothetical protein ACD_73C00279G0009 [uncultured bacterium]